MRSLGSAIKMQTSWLPSDYVLCKSGHVCPCHERIKSPPVCNNYENVSLQDANKRVKIRKGQINRYQYKVKPGDVPPQLFSSIVFLGFFGFGPSFGDGCFRLLLLCLEFCFGFLGLVSMVSPFLAASGSRICNRLRQSQSYGPQSAGRNQNEAMVHRARVK